MKKENTIIKPHGKDQNQSNTNKTEATATVEEEGLSGLSISV